MKLHFGRTWLAVSATLAALATSAAFAAPQLIKNHGKPPAHSNAAGLRSQATAVNFNAEEMLNLQLQDEVELSLPSAKKHSYIFELKQDHGDGIYSWIGKHKAKGNQYRAIVTTGPSGTYAVFGTPDGEYRLVPGNGNDWLIDMTAEDVPGFSLGDDAVIPPPSQTKLATEQFYAPTFIERVPGVNSVFAPEAMPTPQAVVDIMFVYTTGLANNLGTNLMTRLHFLVTRANTSYTDSEIAITLRLVNATMVDYTDANDNAVALPAIQSGSGVFANIETIRTAVGADVVAFMRNGASFGGGGRGYVPVPTSAATMYSVTTGCTAGCESVFIHEVGHNFGNMHDRSTVAWQDGGTPTPSTGLNPYSYGHYYCASGTLTCNPSLPNAGGGCTSQPECSGGFNANNFATLMTYFHGSATTLYKFSNPSVTMTCGATLQPCGVLHPAANSADNALSMNNNRFILSALKATTVGTPPGSLQFTATSFSAAETAGNASLTVSRTNGSAGAVSVSYATADGTAVAGLDYTATSGTLNWANGDIANKTILIPITNDGVTENGESFSVVLSNATGPAGVFIGAPASATATILSPWPLGDTIPAGWNSTATPAAPWTTAADQVNEGTTSLRSHNVIGTVINSAGGPPANYGNSDLATTSMQFTAGYVTFAYNVIAAANFAYLEFMIDDVVVFSDTSTYSGGVAVWKTASVPITAGAHTLKWRYRNSANPNCSNAGWLGILPAPAGTAACADRAWIDAVTMPVVLATATNVLGSNLNPSTSGQSVTFTATVSGGSGTPTGIVNFKDGASSISGCNAVALNGSGVATCATSALSVASHAITAQYSGNATYNVVTSNMVNQVVNAGGVAKHSEFNGDTRSDVLWRDTTGGLVYQWQLNGLAVSGQGYLPSVPTIWTVAGIGDASGDGRADVLWRDNTGQTYLWTVSALTVPSQGYMPSVPAPWVVTGMGDTNGDGRADVLWRNPTSGLNYLWILNGLTITSQGYLPSVAGTDWEVAAVADVSGDGRADVLWRNKASGLIYLWIMNGLAITSQGYMPSVPTDWEVVGAPDTNADGRADILWRNKVNGMMYLWQMNGLALSGQGYLLQVADANWKVVGYGDYDGDGRGDVLWRNATTGTNYLWTLNGLSVASQGFLPGVTGTNWTPIKR